MTQRSIPNEDMTFLHSGTSKRFNLLLTLQQLYNKQPSYPCSMEKNKNQHGDFRISEMTGSPKRGRVQETSLIPGVTGYTVPPWPNLERGILPGADRAKSSRRRKQDRLWHSEWEFCLANHLGWRTGIGKACAGRRLSSPFSLSALLVRQ